MDKTIVTACDCCAGAADPDVPPYQVFQPEPLHLVRRRAVLGTSFASTAAVLLAACAAPAPTAPAPTATPVPAPTAVPKPAGGQEPPAVAKPAEKPAVVLTVGPSGKAGLEKIELAFCSQVLCILPYEVARRRGIWETEGLDVSLIYMRGGAQAMNALLANSIDWAGTPMDLVVQAWGKEKKPVMLVSTANLPFFALATGPKAGVSDVKGLEGKKIGVGNLATTDHLLAQFILRKGGVDPSKVEFVALGPNLYDLLLRGDVDAGMVQDPALTLLERAGGKTLVNFMSEKDTTQHLGGPYQFMGLNARPETLQAKPETARKLVRGLIKANQWIRDTPGAEIVKSAPSELVAGGDLDIFAASLDRFKRDLYPADGALNQASIQRVVDVQTESGVLKDAPPFKATDLFSNAYQK